MRLEVRVITDFSEFSGAPFAPSYRRFLARMGGIYPLYFGAEPMAIMHPLYSEEGERPFFVVVQDGADIVGFLPLQLRVFGRKPWVYRRLRLWGKVGRYNSSHHSDFLVLPEYEQRAAAAAIEFIEQSKIHDYDEVVFERVSQDSCLGSLVGSRFLTGNTLRGDEQVLLYEATTALSQRIKGETRRKIRKANEKLFAGFAAVEFDCHTSLNDELFAQLSQLHIDRQRELIASGRKRMSFFEDDLERAVFKAHLRYCQTQGALRIYTLRLDGDMACFLICISCNGYTDALVTAFMELPEPKHMARCLWYYAFEQELDVYASRVINMGYGAHILKRTFSTRTVPLISFSCRNKARLCSMIKNRLRGWVSK